MKLTGFAAIEYAEKEGLRLNKLADPHDDAAHHLSIAEATAIAADRPDSIWIVVPEDERREMLLPGDGAASETGRGIPRRAGQLSDELLPGESNQPQGGHTPRASNAAGTPAGGLASGGLAGTNAGHGEPENADLEAAMGTGIYDENGDASDDTNGDLSGEINSENRAGASRQSNPGDDKQTG